MEASKYIQEEAAIQSRRSGTVTYRCFDAKVAMSSVALQLRAVVS